MTGIRTKGWSASTARLRGWTSASLAAIAVLVSAAAVACSDQPVAPAAIDAPLGAVAAKLGPLSAANAGAYHNAFLDFSFPRVRRAISQGADHAQGCRVIAQAMRDFVVLNKLPVHPREIGDAIGGGRCAEGQADARKPRLWLADDGVTTPEFNAMIAEMEYAVDAGLPQSDIAALFDQKVAYARANFPPVDAEVIEAAASIGLSSVQYWEANYVTQSEQLLKELSTQVYSRLPDDAPRLSAQSAGQNYSAPNAPLFWRGALARIGVADLKGAVHGGIMGARGGWSGALAGAAIEGGARSAAALLAEVL